MTKKEGSAGSSVASVKDNGSPPPANESLGVEESPSSLSVGSNNNNANEASVKSQFPMLLHNLLSRAGENANKEKEEEDKADNPPLVSADIIAKAIEWLPGGKGFRVLRWDVLTADVLPKDFPMLCDELFGKSGGGRRKQEEERDDSGNKDGDAQENNSEKVAKSFSDDQWVEAFLSHVKAWGFEEVRKGRDRGSFRHELFVKHSPEMCSGMKCRSHVVNNQSTIPLTPTYSMMDIGRSSSNLEMEHAPSLSSSSWRSKAISKTVSSIFKPRRRSNSYSKSSSPANNGNSNPQYHHHPTHLHVPVLTSSFAEGWGASEHPHQQHQPYGGPPSSEQHYHNGSSSRHHHPQQHPQQHPQHHHQQQQHYPPPAPYPPPTRSPRTIRFRDEPNVVESTPQQRHHKEDVAVEITPDPNMSEADPSPLSTAQRKMHPVRGFVSRRGRRPGLISRHATH